VVDGNGTPIADAVVDVWQSSTEGLYENQDPNQADMNLRGQFRTDANGRFAFRSILPAGYPIPVDGPVGDFIRAVKRPHNYRPAHIHFLIYKPGFKTMISQIYVNDDPLLETDVQFGVTRALIGNYVRHEHEVPPAADVTGPWYSFDYTFAMEAGEAKLPRPPISGKAVKETPSPAMAR
jgi:catechol 1,2-dioxygenase